MRTTTGNLYFEIFGVKERLHCVWDCNMPALNSEFLNSVDHDYFHYLGEIHTSALAGPNKLRAAIALHTAYYHGLETLFSLIFAGLHTWKAVPAWILKCPTEELRKLVADIQLNQQSPNAQMHFEEYSWKSISALFNGVALRGNKENERIAEDIGKLWEMFAEDFIDGFIVEAYNSFKHGFRVKLGGVKISFKAAAKPE